MRAISVYWMLVADVDGTLLGDEDGWSRLGKTLEANGHILLVPNSSRPLISLEKSWQERQFSIGFPAQVGALGTEVTIEDKDVGWSGRLRWFDRTLIDKAMADMGYVTNGDEFQTPLKASYVVPRERWPRVAASVHRISLVKIVTSGESDFDVIPDDAGKEAPIEYLSQHFKISTDHVVAAGDSMNDLTMLAAAPNRIVVANAEPDLIASTSGIAIHCTSSHADGVIEGLQSLGVLG